MEYDLAATSITGGDVVHHAFTGITSSKAAGIDKRGLLSKRALSLNAAGTTSDTITVAGSGLNTSSSMVASLTWKELY